MSRTAHAIGTYDHLIRRLDKLATRLSAPAQVLDTLPSLVLRVDWPDAGDAAPSWEAWKAMLTGELPLDDEVGYEEQNEEHARLAHRVRIAPKVYVFDTDCEGADR
jgi:hypothetical protein